VGTTRISSYRPYAVRRTESSPKVLGGFTPFTGWSAPYRGDHRLLDQCTDSRVQMAATHCQSKLPTQTLSARARVRVRIPVNLVSLPGSTVSRAGRPVKHFHPGIKIGSSVPWDGKTGDAVSHCYHLRRTMSPNPSEGEGQIRYGRLPGSLLRRAIFALSGNHPDVSLVVHEERGAARSDVMRTNVQHDCRLHAMCHARLSCHQNMQCTVCTPSVPGWPACLVRALGIS
jgi:hypothetical protein